MTLLTLNNPWVTKTMWLDIWGLGLDGRLSAQVKYNGIWVQRARAKWSVSCASLLFESRLEYVVQYLHCQEPAYNIAASMEHLAATDCKSAGKG